LDKYSLDPIYLSFRSILLWQPRPKNVSKPDAEVHRLKKGKEEVMAKKGEVYKCDICGNVVSVVEGGDGDLVCCGQNMRLLSEEEVSKL
jgi:desulfoferrodoxin-like iron-binding protein